MKCLYTHDNLFVVYNIRNILANNNIDCEIRNELVSSGAGELPPTEVWPELWVLRERDYEQSEKILADSLKENLRATSWLCFKCNETNPPAFELCWHCGSDSQS